LLELLMVLFAVGLFASLLALRVEGIFSGGDLRLASRIVIGEITRLRGLAAATHRERSLRFQVDENVLYAGPEADDGESVPGSGIMEGGSGEKRIPLPRGVMLKDVVLFPTGKVQDGVADMRFYPNGCVDRTLIHLENEEGEAYSLEVNPLTGRVTIYEGYIEQKSK